jgi:UDP-N-acetylmuramoyl-tripeptide--D-alanyl-D-alanine ligase
MTAVAALWTAEEAVAATGGYTAITWEAAGISIDSRTLEPADLFVALKGPNFDGHAFIADAFTRGATAAMVEDPPKGIAATAPVLVVPDTLTALGDMGAAARRRTGARIIAERSAPIPAASTTIGACPSVSPACPPTPPSASSRSA